MAVKRYRKKPIEIDAFQYDGDPQAVQAWIGEVEEQRGTASGRAIAQYHAYLPGHECDCRIDGSSVGSSHVAIRTLEGDLVAPFGWWLIRGIKGEYYPCRPDIFAATYDEVTTT